MDFDRGAQAAPVPLVAVHATVGQGNEVADRVGQRAEPVVVQPKTGRGDEARDRVRERGPLVLVRQERYTRLSPRVCAVRTWAIGARVTFLDKPPSTRVRRAQLTLFGRWRSANFASPTSAPGQRQNVWADGGVPPWQE